MAARAIALALGFLALVAVAQSKTYECTEFAIKSRDGCTNNAYYYPSMGNPDALLRNPQFYDPPCRITTDLPPTLQDTVRTLFPEGKHPDPSMIRPDVFAYTTAESNISFTYVSTGAGYTNRIGYATYTLANGVGSATNIRFAFPRINTNGGAGCLRVGDTFKFTNFPAHIKIIFFMDANSKIADRFWSYINVDEQWTNPDTTECVCSTGYIHGSWAYLTKEDITIFGFEDMKIGDADYNDAMFFLTYEGNVTFNEVPPYEDGTLKVCNIDTQVSDKSYAEYNCTQWGLLESTAAQSCLTYMSIPRGWTWALDSDPFAKAAIETLAPKWGYTQASCFLLSLDETHGVGYTPSGGLCDPKTYSIKTLYNETSGLRCYNAACTSRFVLKGANLGSDCVSGGYCESDSLGKVINREPVSSEGMVQYPTSASVYLKGPGASVPVTTSITVPSNSKQLDVFVILDVASTSSSDMNNIANSWKNVLGALRGNLDAAVGLAVFSPATTTGGYTLDSEFSLTTSSSVANGWTNKFRTTSASCHNTKMYDAVAAVLRNPAINWRPDAYHAVWVLSACSMDTSSSAMREAVIQTGITPVFGALVQKRGDTPSGFDRNGDFTGTYAPYSKFYHSGLKNSWSDPFQPFATDKGVGVVRGLWSDVFAIPASDPQGFLKLPTSSSTLTADAPFPLDHSLVWPTGLTNYEKEASFSAVLRVMGRQTTSYTINFNHKPVIKDTLAVTAVVDTYTPIVLDPKDSDGDLMRLTFSSLPTLGKVFPSGDHSQEFGASSSTRYGSTAIDYYVASGQTGTTDTFTVLVNDGCASVPVTITVTILTPNRPPVAQDFTIRIQEDSGVADDNGLIDFTNHISDPDNDPLTVITTSSPNPSKHGFLTTYLPGQKGTKLPLGEVAKLIRYELNQPSGSGNVTFTYKVNDGRSDSNTATVLIVIDHVNHAPVLTIPVTNYKVLSTSGPVTIQATITDADGSNDVVNLYAVASTLTGSTAAYQVSGNAMLDSATAAPTDASPFQFFTNAWGPTSGNTFPVTGLSWTPNGQATAISVSVTFQARDRIGAESNNVVVTFDITPFSPPTWTVRPHDAHPAVFEMNQGSSLVTGLDFAATDTDIDPVEEWKSLIFTLQSKSSHATISLVSGSESVVIAQGADFSQADQPTYVTWDLTNKWSKYAVKYTPGPIFDGEDSFSFVVRDVNGLYATEPAVVNVLVHRLPTPPKSADCNIYDRENEWASSELTLESTNTPPQAVSIQLLSVNFPGVIANDPSYAPWAIEDNTTATLDPTTKVFVKGNFGEYSDPITTPVGSFTFRPIEPTGSGDALLGPEYTCRVFLEHINHPPTSNNYARTIRKRELLTITLDAQDPDRNDPVDSIRAVLKSLSITNKGKFYRDAAATQELDITFITGPDGGDLGTARTFYYRSDVDFSTNNLPLARFTFNVVDKQGLASTNDYQGTITVLPAGDPPQYGGQLSVTTFQETPVPMVLNVGVTTETGASAVVTIKTLPTRGDLFACDDNSICTKLTADDLPYFHTGTTGRVVFSPQAFDWSDNDLYTSFEFVLRDTATDATAPYTMSIYVIHVNKNPFIVAENFLTTAESSTGIIVNESSSHVFRWSAWDQDSLPSTLTTSIRVAFYTTQGFSLYQCTGTVADWANDAECTFDASVPFGVRADFTKNARKSLSSHSTVSTTCPMFDALKQHSLATGGAHSDDCQAFFKLTFAPTPGASYTPYIAITFMAVDDYEAESTPITALIYVKAINTPPTITSPPLVLAASGITNPFIRDTNQDSPNFNQPVVVGDEDHNGNTELLTITVNEGFSGELTWPTSAPCWVDPSNAQVWYCRDRIPAFNQWLGDLRFKVTSGERADLTFVINDLGHSSDYRPSANLTASSQTSIRLGAAVITPKGNSSTLAIAVGVAAAAGLLLLGALGFFLRKAVAPPSNDYFSAATTPLSAAPQSPLYQPQNTTFENALYKGQP